MRYTCFAFTLLFLIVSCANDRSSKSELLHYIPENSDLIIRSNNLESLKSSIENNDVINQLSSARSFKRLNENFKPFSIINTNGNVLICISKDDNDSLQQTLITPFHEKLINTDSLLNYSEELHVARKYELTKSTLENQVLYSAIVDSAFIASTSKKVVEEAFDDDRPTNMNIEKLFATSKSTNTTSFILNTDSNLVTAFSLQDSLDLKNLADYIMLDAELNQNSLVLNGICKATDSSKLLNAFKGSRPQENQLAKITPANSDGFLSITFNEFEAFHKNLRELEPRDSLKIETSLFDNILEVGVIYEATNHAIVLNSIDAISTKEALLGEQNLVENFRQVAIYNFSDNNLFAETFSPFISFNSASLYCVIDDYFVFSNSIGMLQNIIANYQNKTTLSERDYYKDINMHLTSASSFLIVANDSSLKSILKKNIGANLKLDFSAYKASAIQFISDITFAHVNMVIKKHKTKAYQHDVTEELQIKVDNDLMNDPQFVINHKTKQKDIVVQDINNTLYLISNKGKVLWKKQLQGAILGTIEQIDMYKNGRLQMAFATKNRVYVLDRNGKDVSPFPLRFNDPITQPLSVFDYDKNKKYRLVVTQGRNVLMYDAKGKTVEGFTFKKADKSINQQPQHFRIGRKDYLVFKTDSKLYILDRIGKTRVMPKSKNNYSNEAVYLYNNKFTTSSSDGHLITIDTKGNVATENLGLSEAHHIYATSKTLVTQSDNKLSIRNRSVELDFGNYSKPKIFYLNDKIYISTTDLQAQKVHLYDSQAKAIPNFPIYGNSSIVLDNIDKDRQLEFVTKGDDNSILLYQIN